MADTSPQALMAAANCFQCNASNVYTATLMELAMLSQIVTTGLGGGGGQILVYTTTDPTTDGVFPTDVTKPAIAYKNDGNGATFSWSIATGTWV